MLDEYQYRGGTLGHWVGIRPVARLAFFGGESRMSNGLELRRVPETDRSPWESFVERHPKATVFHASGWLEAVRYTFGYEPRHRLVYNSDGSEPVGAIPGFVVPEFAGKSVVNPFCEYGFPLIDERLDDAAVLEPLSRQLGPLGAMILKDTDWSGIRGYARAGYGGVRTGTSIRIDADRPYRDVRDAAFDRDVRRCVRRAERHGVEVREGILEEFYPMYLETMRRLGSPQFPRRFFDALLEQLQESVTILLATRRGQLLGGMLLLEWRATTIPWTVASDRDYWTHRPTHLLYVRTIERACESDRTVVDLGRSRRGSGVHDFKAQFGGVPHPLVSFVAPPQRTGRASLEEYGRAAALTTRLGPVITQSTVGPALKEFIHE